MNLIALVISGLIGTSAVASDFTCKGIKGNKATATLKLNGNIVDFVDSNKMNAHGPLQEVGKDGWAGILIDSVVKFNAFSLSGSLITQGKGVVSGYYLNGGHPGDTTTLMYYCNRRP